MRKDRGTALVEFAFIFSLIMVIAIGAFEWGMGFRDRLAVSQAVREAARVGAAFGDASDADCAILEGGAGALFSIGGLDVKEIWIYETDENGAPPSATKQRYRPAVDTDNPASLKCSGGWFAIDTSWNPSSRDSSGPVRDWLGVRVIADHAWKTGLFWWNGTVEWQESSIFHLEPKIIS